MKTIFSIEGIIDALRNIKQKLAVISIDGCLGVGKSTLAWHIVDSLCCDIFDLDSYLKEKISENNGYEDSICYTNLARDINLSTKNGVSAVVDGVCVLNVLNRIKLIPDIMIYVDSVTYASEIYPFKKRSSSEILNDFSANLFLLNEIKRYHLEVKPLEIADILFERQEL